MSNRRRTWGIDKSEPTLPSKSIEAAATLKALQQCHTRQVSGPKRKHMQGHTTQTFCCCHDIPKLHHPNISSIPHNSPSLFTEFMQRSFFSRSRVVRIRSELCVHRGLLPSHAMHSGPQPVPWARVRCTAQSLGSSRVTPQGLVHGKNFDLCLRSLKPQASDIKVSWTHKS